MTARMLSDGLKNAGLESLFEVVLSADQVRSYKPDARVYQMGIDKLRLRREEILFVAFAGWDVAGAKWFGYPTFWVNRLNSPAEQLGIEADGSGPDLNALLNFVLPKPAVTRWWDHSAGVARDSRQGCLSLNDRLSK